LLPASAAGIADRSGGDATDRLSAIYEKASSGAGGEKELFKEPGRTHIPTSWSRDGRFLLYHTTTAPKTGDDLWVLPLQGDRKPALLLGTGFNEPMSMNPLTAAFSMLSSIGFDLGRTSPRANQRGDLIRPESCTRRHFFGGTSFNATAQF
jgi:hypothetical protein